MNKPGSYVPPDGLFEGRVILVTGSSRGLGREVALRIAALGGTVVLHGRDEKRLAAVYDEIEALGFPQPAAIPLDYQAATSQQLAELAGQIEANLKRLDGIVHCAASVHRLTPTDGMSVEEWLALLKTNTVVPLGLTRACLPLLRAAPDAAVVYTVEEHAETGGAYWGPVAVPGNALLAAMRAQAAEWALLPRLRVNAVVPGPVASPSRAVTHPGHPMSAWAAPGVVLPAYCFAAGPASLGVTGQVLHAQA